jgi:hypothetical protein
VTNRLTSIEKSIEAVLAKQSKYSGCSKPMAAHDASWIYEEKHGKREIRRYEKIE